MVYRFALMCAAVLWSTAAFAQPLGMFRWQLQPYCNVISVAVTQTAGVYTLDGYDDQCGAATRAPVNGVAVPNPNGTIEIGLNIVSSPGAAPVHVAVPLNFSTLGGTWKDSAGNTGTFVFTPNGGTGGAPRPAAVVQSTVTSLYIPTGSGLTGSVSGGQATIRLATGSTGAFDLSNTAGFVAGGLISGGTIPATGAGTRAMWYPGKWAFRAGNVAGNQWDDANIGIGSTAFGVSTVASGAGAVAMGDRNLATGPASTAMGLLSRAEGATSVAMGWRAVASGDGSVVLGSDAIALPAATGAIILADRSSLNKFTGYAANEFLVRAAGGTGIYSNSSLTAGVTLAPGASAWAAISDVNMKEHFRDLDGEDVLAKLARMPIREWSYKAQDASIRHAGPTAQDFHDAFGLGEDRLRISTIDADGIALRAVQALEARTRAFNERLAELLDRIATLEAALEANRR